MTVQTHIHLRLASNTSVESGQYHVKMGTVDETPTVPLVVERALDGTFHFSSLLRSTGLPLVINDSSFTVVNCSKAEILFLQSISSQLLYYIPLDHGNDGDSAGHTAVQQLVVMRIKQGSVTHIDPFQQYWQAGIELFDARSV